MAKVNNNDKEAIRKENIEQTVSKTDQFFSENKKTIWGTVIAVVVIGLAVLGYNKFVYQPKCAEAMQQAFPSEQSFAAGQWEVALNGDGNAIGLAEVINQYGAKAGKAVYMEAGICALQMGEFEIALDYLKKYNGKEPILAARALACQGDAYVGLEDYSSAVTCFMKAAEVNDNAFAPAYLVKAGLAYEKLGDNAKALECYKKVKDQYPTSIEFYDIDSYISAISAK